MRFLLLLCSLLLFTSTSAQAVDFDHKHSAWNTLLQAHVKWVGGVASQVDYDAIKQEKNALDAYTQSLSEVTSADFDSWSKPEQLAFLINAYNAFTVELILSEYPDLDSIKDIGGWFGSPWKQEFFSLLGKTRTLDQVEHDLIRGSGRYNEPRIHVAVVCASIGCPALRSEAFVAEQLEAQLADSMTKFLSDPSRNSYNNGTLMVSKIFDWYGSDFASLETLFAEHAMQLASASVDRQRIRAGDYSLAFGDYDWALNDVK